LDDFERRCQIGHPAPLGAFLERELSPQYIEAYEDALA
jgi:hypothetical protein